MSSAAIVKIRLDFALLNSERHARLIFCWQRLCLSAGMIITLGNVDMTIQLSEYFAALTNAVVTAV